VKKFVAGACLALVAALPAAGQELSAVPENLLGMVGDWRLEQEDQSLPTCALTFTEDLATVGWLIELHDPCPQPFPAPEAMAAWTVDADGTVIIADLFGTPTLRLVEGENGLFHTEPGVLPAFYLMLPYDAEGFGGEVPDQ
jgi:hypothetical protein